MTEAFLVGGARTPVGKFGGALAEVRADDLAALVVGAVVERNGIDPAAIDDVILGAANQAGEDNRNVARMAVLLSGLPHSIPGFTVNRLCASGLQAIASASQAIQSGDIAVAIAGGAESMTRAPWVMAKPGTPWAKPPEMADTSLGWRLVNPRMRDIEGGDATLSLGACTEKLASLHGISRDEADAYAARSQSLAAQCQESGGVEGDIVAVATRGGDVVVDETVRAGTTVEVLARLKPSFASDGIVTAGNASPLSDGASALIVSSGEALERHGLVPRARIRGYAVAGVEPSLFGMGPVPAIRSLLDKTGVSLDEVDVVEINEAFAAQVLVCQKLLGVELDQLNPAGGALALGHPLGSSGSRIAITALGQLERTQGRYAIISLCIGVGQGAAMLIERV